MIKKLDKTLAEQVVNTVKDVSGQDINFIDQSGIIFASTNPTRIGTFHEIGQKAALTGTSIEVVSDNSFAGTQKGINMPIYHNHTLLAVIGITGDPDKVRKYVHLAERITNLLIRERELSIIAKNQSDKKHFLIDSLVSNVNVNINYINDCFHEFQINTKSEKRIILIKVDTHSNTSNLSVLESKVIQLFSIMQLNLFTFRYPNEYLAVMDSSELEKKAYFLTKFANTNKTILKVSVGKNTNIYQISESYQTAVTAIKSITPETDGFVCFDDLTLEILFSHLKEQEKQEFLQKTISYLSKEDVTLIKTYFESNLSLTKTGEILFLHKNTLQYRLNVIAKKTGFNPRIFKEAVLLYLAIKL